MTVRRLASGEVLQESLDGLAARHHVPGAVVGVRQGDETTLAATGVTNRRTGVETTTDTLFHLGSITKVWTATAIVQLAAEGRLASTTRCRRRYRPCSTNPTSTAARPASTWAAEP